MTICVWTSLLVCIWEAEQLTTCERRKNNGAVFLLKCFPIKMHARNCQLNQKPFSSPQPNIVILPLISRTIRVFVSLGASKNLESTELKGVNIWKLFLFLFKLKWLTAFFLLLECFHSCFDHQFYRIILIVLATEPVRSMNSSRESLWTFNGHHSARFLVATASLKYFNVTYL